MKVYLSRDEYNNNVTPTYCRDDEFALDDDVTLRFSEPNFGQLIIEGDPLKVLAILQDIALEKTKHRFWQNGAKVDKEEVIWILTRNISVVFDVQARRQLAKALVGSEEELYRSVCEIASRALREGRTTVDKGYVDMVLSERRAKQEANAEPQR